jgi:large subunit ribosomal protein L10
MVKSLLLLPLGFIAASAFTGQPLVSRAPVVQSSLYMGGANGGATLMPGKMEKVAKVKGLLDSSQMVFTVPASSITVAQSQTLRRSLPEGSYVSVVKNTIMLRAIEGTEYEAAASMLKGANMWFFIEEDIGSTIKAYNSFLIGQLPSKDELYAKIAGSIKAVPTKVARVIKAPNSKLARAIKLATESESEE